MHQIRFPLGWAEPHIPRSVGWALTALPCRLPCRASNGREGNGREGEDKEGAWLQFGTLDPPVRRAGKAEEQGGELMGWDIKAFLCPL